LFHCSGVITATNGNIYYSQGAGFTVSHPSGGTYNIVFTTAHPRQYFPVIATPQTNAAGSITIGSVSTGGFTAHTWNSSFTAADLQFGFVVLL
jgi:hypothetical protein